MDKAEFAAKMATIFPDTGYDNEGAHRQADDLMVEVLQSIGYDLDKFKEAHIWYA